MLLSLPQSIVIRGESDSHKKGPIISHICLEPFKTPSPSKSKPESSEMASTAVLTALHPRVTYVTATLTDLPLTRFTHQACSHLRPSHLLFSAWTVFLQIHDQSAL